MKGKLFCVLAILIVAFSLTAFADGSDTNQGIGDNNNSSPGDNNTSSPGDNNNSSPACVTEGNTMPVYPGYACCEGLSAIPTTSTNSDGTITPLIGASICSKCGNESCEQWENYANCPADCKTPTTTEPIQENITVKEQVKCIFNTTKTQSCYSGDKSDYFSCTTNEKDSAETNMRTCVADVYGTKGTKIVWKSSCGGYAYTYLDGENEYAKFNCTPSTEPTYPVEGSTIQTDCVCTTEYDPVCAEIKVCTQQCQKVDVNSNSLVGANCKEQCYAEKKTYGNECNAKCAGASVLYKGKCGSDCPQYATPVCEDGKIIIVFDERGCKKPKCSTEKTEHFLGAYWKCSNGQEFKEMEKCMPYAYWKEKARKICAKYVDSNSIDTNSIDINSSIESDDDNSSEQESDDLTTSPASKERPWVVAFEVFGNCSPSDNGCKYYTDEQGCKVKDCADGEKEISCPTKISRNTYRNAYWQCQSGVEFNEGGESSCKPVGLWKNYAEEACKNECSADTNKCGVNSFKVWEECYDGTPTLTSTQSTETVSSLKEECYANNSNLVAEVDENGTKQYLCKVQNPNACTKKEDLPKEKILDCEGRGGEFATQADESGCLTYVECIGEKIFDSNKKVDSEILNDKIKLLDLAMKLETAKIELLKIAAKVNAIADYYAEQGNPDANNFYKAANILEAAANKLDEIKDEIKNNIDSLTPEKIESIREYIRDIKEEMLKEALLAMLG